MNNNEITRPENRVVYFDVLRVLATLAVIVLHISVHNWYDTDVHTSQWLAYNFYDSMVRWCVPIFVMISGALFLGRNISLQKLFSKNILRIVTAFIVWATIYSAVEFLEGTPFFTAVLHIPHGHYHMWFLLMIVGIYLVIPFMQKIAESRTLTKYFLLLTLIFTFAIPQISSILSLFNAKLGNGANMIERYLQFHFTLGYVGYFVLGYYLSTTEISKKVRWIIYGLAVTGFVLTFALSTILSHKTGIPDDTFYKNTTFSVLAESIGVFVFFKYNVTKLGKRMSTIVTKLSLYSFGAYLVHAMVIEQLDYLFGFSTENFSPFASVPAVTLVVFVISFFISNLINKIPHINKYIV